MQSRSRSWNSATLMSRQNRSIRISFFVCTVQSLIRVITFSWHILQISDLPSLAPSDGEVSYLKERYKKGNELAGNYLNKGGNGYATNKYHETTYATYTKVQAAAEPLYWRTTNKETLPGSVHNGNYINYYILHISWDKDVQDNKETDMVYLMAG